MVQYHCNACHTVVTANETNIPTCICCGREMTTEFGYKPLDIAPPLGVMNRKLHDSQRMKELAGAILRSVDAGFNRYPQSLKSIEEWATEIADIARFHREGKK